jgi:hypothetical protein
VGAVCVFRLPQKAVFGDIEQVFCEELDGLSTSDTSPRSWESYVHACFDPLVTDDDGGSLEDFLVACIDADKSAFP